MAEDKRLLLAIALISTFLLLTLVGAFTIPLARAESDSSSLLISMPDESLNYTIVDVNGAPWAKIDGYYPIHQTYGLEGELPMVYPTPPGTVNITLTCNGEKLNWTDYTAFDSEEATHYTDIGNWSMIMCLVPLKSNNFVLTIHYEHPVQIINGSYTFLYDLNISPYLSSSYNVSTAHFAIRWESKESNIRLYTTGNNGTWSRRSFNSVEDNGIQVMNFDIVSDYSKPLPGDIVVTFDTKAATPLYILIGLAALIVGALLVVTLIYKRTHRINPER